MAATCEIGGCGVAALGRCASCGRAFCGSHQARKPGPGYMQSVALPIADSCGQCQASAESHRLAEGSRWLEDTRQRHIREAGVIVREFLSRMAERGNPGTEKAIELALRPDRNERGEHIVRQERTGDLIDVWHLTTDRHTSGKYFGTDQRLYCRRGPEYITKSWFRKWELATAIYPEDNVKSSLAIESGHLVINLRRIASAHRVSLPTAAEAAGAAEADISPRMRRYMDSAEATAAAEADISPRMQRYLDSKKG